jgi:predicted CXXCH cytochrome family protein
LLLIATCIDPSLAGVVDTVHNLSVSGPGSIKAASEQEVCIFCHTSHNSTPSGPLWNRNDSGGNYIPYSSSTAAANPGDPTGASILCLSCHDGTIALGSLVSRTTDVTVIGGPNMPAGPSNLSTDLSDDHPISFSYAAAQSGKPTKLVLPSSLTGVVKLDGSGQLQCTSCHDAHENQFGKFLVMPKLSGGLCLTCHIQQGWAAGSHATSGVLWNGLSVANHACDSCHVPHSADGNERLLRNLDEENVCYTCHDGSVASTNIQGEFGKFSLHPVANTTGTHDPGETAVVNTRHVECIDCHNPHAAAASGSPSGPLNFVRGVNISGNEIDPAAREYEICFRCHADSAGKPPPPTTRLLDASDGTNTRLEFSTSVSYHPVVSVAANTSNPSLVGMPVPSGSIIACTDCHDNNSTAGPDGPHGSIYPQLLTRQYLTQDNTPESASAYALCYGCHNRASILNDDSFSRHNRHIDETPCNTCHDPHGSQWPRLINFDTTIVFPNRDGLLEFVSDGPGTFSGSCSLDCHGKDHRDQNYRP